MNEHAVKRITQDVSNLGYAKLIMKTDGEPSIVALKEAIRQNSSSQIIPEVSPVGESQSNGSSERGVQMIEDMVRTLKAAIEDRIGRPVPCNSALMSWLFQSYAQNRYDPH